MLRSLTCCRGCYRGGVRLLPPLDQKRPERTLHGWPPAADSSCPVRRRRPQPSRPRTRRGRERGPPTRQPTLPCAARQARPGLCRGRSAEHVPAVPLQRRKDRKLLQATAERGQGLTGVRAVACRGYRLPLGSSCSVIAEKVVPEAREALS